MNRTDSPPEAAEEENHSAAPDAARRSMRDRLAHEWEQRLALPVIIAAAVSVPAVFLTMTDATVLQLAGHTLNWASLVVLGGEATLLLVLCGDKVAWLRRHKWALAITVTAVPAVLFAVAPVQALRLLKLIRIIGTLRILRANTIVSAGRTLARRFGLAGRWRFVPVLAATLLAAGFVVMVLADPTSSQQHAALAAEVSAWSSVIPVVGAGLILAAATFIVVRYRRRAPAGDGQAPASTGAPASSGD